MTPAEIVARLDQLKMARSNIEQIWNIVERYIMPLRLGDMYETVTGENSLELIRDDVYDSTAIHASQKMSNQMHGSITNPIVMWFKYVFQAPEMRKERDGVAWLEDCTERVYGEMYRSNFDPEISSAYQDLVGPGNCVMVCEVVKEDKDDWRGFSFTAVPLKEAFFERDAQGDVYRFFRWLRWTASEIKSKWPEPGMLSPEMEKVMEKAGADDRFDIIYAIYTRPQNYANRNAFPLAPDLRPVGCQYVFKACGQTIGKEDGYYDMPAYHCPWERTSGSVWGHGPGMVMAPTVLYLNSWMEMEDLALRKMVEPSSLVTERGLLSDLDLKPAGITVVRDINNSIKAYHSEGRIDLSEQKVQDLRNQIREAFHNDELQLKDSPQMSATEAQIRYELMNRVLGPTLARIQTNLLDPMLNRMFRAMLRNGQFKPVPESVKAAKAQLKVDYSGPLMRAQKSDEVAAIERFVGQIGAMAKAWPAVMNVLDPVKVARELASRMGVPADVLRSESEVKSAIETQQKMMALQARAQVQQQQGEAAKAQAEGAAASDQAQGQVAA